MKRNKRAKFEVLGPEGIEDGLMGMGRAIEAGGPWTHPEMERIVLQSRESRTVEERGMPEWRGAASQEIGYGRWEIGGFVNVNVKVNGRHRFRLGIRLR